MDEKRVQKSVKSLKDMIKTIWSRIKKDEEEPAEADITLTQVRTNATTPQSQLILKKSLARMEQEETEEFEQTLRDMFQFYGKFLLIGLCVLLFLLFFAVSTSQSKVLKVNERVVGTFQDYDHRRVSSDPMEDTGESKSQAEDGGVNVPKSVYQQQQGVSDSGDNEVEYEIEK